MLYIARNIIPNGSQTENRPTKNQWWVTIKEGLEHKLKSTNKGWVECMCRDTLLCSFLIINSILQKLITNYILIASLAGSTQQYDKKSSRYNNST